LGKDWHHPGLFSFGVGDQKDAFSVVILGSGADVEVADFFGA
jgi:nucleoside-specific outer membrane channel protein Tsx